MKPNPVGWFEIYVKDMQRAVQFYESVFQVNLERLELPGFEMMAFPMEENRIGAPGTLVKSDAVDPDGNGVLVYFSCDDCSIEAGRVAEHGGKLEREKHSIGPYGFVAFAIDTEGNRIGLHSKQ